jgi:hypothetical protein
VARLRGNAGWVDLIDVQDTTEGEQPIWHVGRRVSLAFPDSFFVAEIHVSGHEVGEGHNASCNSSRLINHKNIDRATALWNSKTRKGAIMARQKIIDNLHYLGVKIEWELWKKLKIHSISGDISVGCLVRKILTDYVNNEENRIK